MCLMDDFGHLNIPLKDIKAATNNFTDKPIGAGGFGKVYKGVLHLQNGRRMVAAFKRLDRIYGQGDVEFWKEIMMLSDLKHKNLARLLYFCNEDDERIIVYKYISRGSLDRYLGDSSLTWSQRLIICLGAAKAIAYLHDPKESQQRIVHRDLKSSNILLNDKWTPKVSDFGLSKICPANQPRSYLVSNIVGTPGYCDPAYFETGILSKECDVYSFGVVLFEVICGRLCCVYDKDKLKSILVKWWKKCYDENRLYDIIFPDLKEQINQKALLIFSAIASRCLNRDHKKRPTMVEIVKELEAAIHHQQNNSQHHAIVPKIPVSYQIPEEFHHLEIRLTDIKLATHNFSDNYITGRGSFGMVYRGELSLPEGQRMVCFKRLDRRLGQGDVEFWKEVTMLSKYKHGNIVSLVGFCNEGNEKILVYEQASHGSLDLHLGDATLTWIQRLKICLDVARGLNFLHDHKEAPVRIIHRDIKSANILLDDNWHAKISDFGLSKVSSLDNNQPDLISDIGGTPGYCDPLYYETGILSRESDVYSFGVVLCEVLSGRLCIENREGGKINNLVPGWRKCYDEKRLDEIAFSDPLLQLELGSLNTFSAIAYRCLSKDRRSRPTMATIVKELERALKQQEHFQVTTRSKNPVISNTSQNQLLALFPEGVLVGDGNTWLSKLKNDTICETISSISCISADSVLQDSIENSRFSNVLRGVMHNGFTVKVRTQFLSPKIPYTVNLVFKHSGLGQGSIYLPFKFKFDAETHYSNSGRAHVREDGWLMIELHQFTSCGKKHDFEIEFLPLFQISSSSVEYFVEGIEFLPVEYVN